MNVKLPRFRHVVLALAALAVIGFAGWMIYKGATLERLYQKEAGKAADQAADRARVQMQRDCAPLPPQQKNKCDAEVSNTYRSYRKETRDLEAQRTTALWTAFMGAAALLGMAVSIIGVGLVYITFRATRQSNEIARETAYLQLRAYLSPEEHATMEVWLGDHNMIFAKMDAAVVNSGLTPAILTDERTLALIGTNGGGTERRGFRAIIAPRALHAFKSEFGIPAGPAPHRFSFSVGYLFTYSDYLGHRWTEVIWWRSDFITPTARRSRIKLRVSEHHRGPDSKLKWTADEWAEAGGDEKGGAADKKA
jgi:hypothetical protein